MGFIFDIVGKVINRTHIFRPKETYKDLVYVHFHTIEMRQHTIQCLTKRQKQTIVNMMVEKFETLTEEEREIYKKIVFKFIGFSNHKIGFSCFIKEYLQREDVNLPDRYNDLAMHSDNSRNCQIALAVYMLFHSLWENELPLYQSRTQGFYEEFYNNHYTGYRPHNID